MYEFYLMIMKNFIFSMSSSLIVHSFLSFFPFFIHRALIFELELTEYLLILKLISCFPLACEQKFIQAQPMAQASSLLFQLLVCIKNVVRIMRFNIFLIQFLTALIIIVEIITCLVMALYVLIYVDCENGFQNSFVVVA